MIRAVSKSADGNEDLLLVALALSGVLVTRLMQTFREAKRISASGFTADDVHRNLLAVVDEREARRRELRSDKATLRARRRTLVWAAMLLIGALGMLRAALAFRYTVPEGHRMYPPGVVLLLSAMIMLGVSLPLLLRSPVRMPAGERLFRLVWLGPIGRAFLYVAGRRGRSSSNPTPPPRTRPVTQPAHASNGRAKMPQPSPGARDRVSELEMRVSELERWRKESRR
jgi:hypothetical protein